MLRDLDLGRRTPRIPVHVGQAFLHNAKQRCLRVDGEAWNVGVDSHFQLNAASFLKTLRVPVHCRRQPALIQQRRGPHVGQRPAFLPHMTPRAPGFPLPLSSRISPRVLASLAPRISVFKNSASFPDTKLYSGVPMNFSSGTPKKAAKLLFEYSTVPSSESVAAPSSIVSTSSRYGCSAPCSVNPWSPWLLDTNTASTSPMWIARNVSSSSATRAFRSSTKFGCLVSFFCFFTLPPLSDLQIQPQHHSLLI